MTKWSYFYFFCSIFAPVKNDRTVIFMEQERFTSIHKTFNYTPGSIFTNQWSNLAFGIGMIVVPAIWPFGLRIRRLHILSPAVLSTIFIIGGIVLLVFTWLAMRKARALIREGAMITVDGNRVTYPTVKSGRVEYDTFSISDIEYIKYDEKESQCKVSLPDRYLVFEIPYFDSWEQYEEFRALLG